jgi:hypothetical protein
MDSRFSIGSPNLSSAPIGYPAKNLSYIKARFEFEPFWQDIDQVKADGIPNYRKHHCFRLNRVPLSFRNLSVRLKPYGFMVCIEVEPWLIESHDVVPRSLFLSFQYWQQLL